MRPPPPSGNVRNSLWWRNAGNAKLTTKVHMCKKSTFNSIALIALQEMQSSSSSPKIFTNSMISLSTV